jgi:hypothetical protein
MSIPSDQSHKASAASEILFSHAFVGAGRPNRASSSTHPSASATNFGVKKEIILVDECAVSHPDNSAFQSRMASSKPHKSFPLLGGWGPAAAPAAVPPSAPSEIVVGGVTLAFPFPPYPSQVCMANQMIRAFKLRKHALLESPTGTGDCAQ